MFCRKCGNEIPDDSVFCLKCGTKVEISANKNHEEISMEKENVITEEQDTCANTSDGLHSEEIEITTPSMDKKTVYGIFGIIAIVLVIIIVITASESAKRCEMSSCDNLKQEGSKYCSEHTCKEEGCTRSKTKRDTYCYSHKAEHTCSYSGCDSFKLDGGEYCYSHTCEKTGCYNQKGYGSDYCTDHQVDMRKRLDMIDFSFGLNSAGGIKLTFRAKNKSGKEIKYVRFDITMQNAVGDSLKDDISGDYSIPVEIIGPVKAGKEVYLGSELVGYCDNCARIDVNDVTIIYTDGTSETGRLGYYAD